MVSNSLLEENWTGNSSTMDNDSMVDETSSNASVNFADDNENITKRGRRRIRDRKGWAKSKIKKARVEGT